MLRVEPDVKLAKAGLSPANGRQLVGRLKELEETLGVVLYQDQVLRVCHIFDRYLVRAEGAFDGHAVPVDDETLSYLREQGVVDELGITGYYTMLAMVMNTTRAPLPDGVKPPLQMFPR